MMEKKLPHEEMLEKRKGENVRDTLRRVIDDYISKAEYPHIHIITDPGILIT